MHCVGGIGWSPDSQQIAFLSNIDPGRSIIGQIWILQRDGSDPHPIYTFDQPGVVGAVAWGPDGHQIFCMCEVDSKPHFFLLNSDGRDEPQWVTRGQVPRWWFANFWPQWGAEG